MVVWKNVDTATHTVMSGTVMAETDALFDSGLFGPGKLFPYTFTETGATIIAALFIRGWKAL